MALDSRELMLEKFVAVNKVRYPEFTDRLDKVNVNSIQFDTIAVDPDNPVSGRVSNLESKSLFIEAEEQSWECALMNGDRVLNFSDTTIYASLNDVITNNTRGFYRYQDVNNELVAVQIIPTEYTTPSSILSAALLDLNASANYLIKNSEITITDILSPDAFKILVNGNTIYGELVVVRNDPNKLSAGTWVKGYYGQVLGSDFISPEVLTEMVGIPKANIIYQDENLWLKFSYNGKIVLIAKKPTASNLSYNQLKALNLTEGDRLYPINGVNYYVRLPYGTRGNLYNEWEDLLFHVNVNDPDQLFWESFTDLEMGFGTLDGSALNKGEWNLVHQDDTSVASTPMRGGSASILGYTSTSLDSASPNRGFRPVLIMEGVEGIEWEPAFDVTPPLRLEPLTEPVPGTTDAHPIKTATTRFTVTPPEPSGIALSELTLAIRTLQVRKDENIPAPIFHSTGISDTIRRIGSVTLQTLGTKVVPTSTQPTNTVKGVFGITGVKNATQAPLGGHATVDYSHELIGIRTLTAVPAPKATLFVKRPAVIVLPATNYSQLGK